MGGKILLSEGGFGITTQIVVPSDVVLEGIGFATILRAASSLPVANGVILVGDAAGTGNHENITVRDLMIDGNSANVVAVIVYGIRGLGATIDRLTIENVYIYDTKGQGGQFSGPQFTDVQFTDIFVDLATSTGFEFNGHALSEDMVLTRVHVKDATALGGIYGSNGRHIILRDCYVRDQGGGDGIHLHAGANLTPDYAIEGCHVDNAFARGIYLEGLTTHHKTLAIVRGNHSNNNGGAGIWLKGYVDDSLIEENTCEGNGGDGIWLVDSERNIVAGNRLDNNTGWGINEDAGCDNNDIYDNIVTNNAAGGVNQTGANTKVHDNRGHVTENSGTGTIPSAGPPASVVIAHGCDYTPAAADIVITPTENPTNTPGVIWVDTIGAANFTVNCENDPGGSALDFSWAVRRV